MVFLWFSHRNTFWLTPSPPERPKRPGGPILSGEISHPMGPFLVRPALGARLDSMDIYKVVPPSYKLVYNPH